jgi:F5/8 type C domain-containing protein
LAFGDSKRTGFKKSHLLLVLSCVSLVYIPFSVCYIYAADAGEGVDTFRPGVGTPTGPSVSDEHDTSTNCETLSIENITDSGHVGENIPQYAVDDNVSTAWRTNTMRTNTMGTSSPWLDIDLGQDVDICKINITWEDHNPENIAFYISDDGVAFKKLNMISQTPQQYVTIQNDAFARHIRIVMNQNFGSIIGIKELQLLGMT